MNMFLKNKVDFRFLLLSLFVSFCIPTFGQAPIEWVQSVGDTCNQGFNAIMATDDGGVILTGYEYINDQPDVLFSKLDENGIVQWSKTFGGSRCDLGNSVVQTPDGGFVMAGSTNSLDGIPGSNNGDMDAWILKVNSVGTMQWNHVYGGCGYDEITSISTTTDGGFILSGVTNSPTNNIITENAGKKDAWVLRLNSQGNLVWSRTFGGSKNDNASEIKQTGDGGYAFVGSTWSNDVDITSNGGFSDMWLVKLQGNGNLAWSKTFGGIAEEHARSLDITSDGGYLIAGSSSYLAQSGTATSIHHVDFSVAKITAAGSLSWSNIYGGSKIEEAFGALESSTGEYIISGYSKSSDGMVTGNYGFKDFWVLSLNTGGAMNWSKNYGGTQNDYATALTETQDGGLAFAGWTWSDNNDITTHGGIDDGWVVKLEGAGLPPTLDLGVDKNICFGDQVSITANTTNCDECNFLWNDGNTNASRLLNLTSTSDYIVTVTNSFGQTAIDTINIVVNQLPVVSSSVDNPPCDNAPMGLIDLTPMTADVPFSYSWNTGATSEDLSNIASGNYIVTVTNSKNCIDEFEYIISNPTSFILDAATIQIDCNGDNDGLIDLQITGGTGPFDYQWNTGATTEDVANLAPGNYTVTIEDANLCQKIQNFNIVEPTALQNSALSGNLDCFGNNNGSISLNINGGNPPYTYNWSTGQTTKDINNLTAGNYTVTITDNANCTKIDSYEIESPTELTGVINASQIPCFSSANGAIDLTVSGGTAPYTFDWSDGTTTEDVNDLPAGTYTVVITDDKNCTMTESVTIQMTDELVINDITSSVSCNGDTDGRIDINVTGGNGIYTYQWNNGLTSQDLANLAPGTYDVLVVDDSNCEGTASFQILEPAPITIQNSSFGESCLNSSDASIALDITGGSGNYTYKWSNQSTESNLNNITAGNYFVTVTDANQCTAIQSFQIMTNTAPELETSFANVSCFGLIDGAIDLSISPNNNQYTYSWSNGPATEDLENLAAGSYEVTVNYGNGCNIVEDFTINEPLEILINGNVDNVLCNGDASGAIDLSVSGGSNIGYQYSWDNGMTTESLNNLSGGIYNITVTDNNSNCTSSSSFGVEEPALINLNGNQVDPTSDTSSDGEIQLFPNGGATPYTVIWSNGESTFTLSNLFAGDYTATLTDANDCTFIETFNLMGPVGINDIDLINNFTLFPNPTTNSFNVTANFSKKIKGSFIITNLLGQVLNHHSFDETTVKKEFDVANFPSGIYLVTLQTDDGQQLTEKLVVE